MATELMCARLRDAAADCQNELVRYNLNLVAAELDDAVSAFVLAPSDDNLRRMTGHWAHGQLMIHNSRQSKRPVPAISATGDGLENVVGQAFVKDVENPM